MAVWKIDKRASDNKYLHRDFHISTDLGLVYVEETCGPKAVSAYIRKFVQTYHAPLAQKIRKEGLSALKTYLEHIYAEEEFAQALHTTLDGHCLKVRIDACPAIAHMRRKGYQPSHNFIETTLTLYDELARMSGKVFMLDSYDSETGGARWRFMDQEEMR